MEDALDLYALPYHPRRPLVCCDEHVLQLIAEKRLPLPANPGRPERFDYEYRRQGTRHLFLFFQPLAGWRHVRNTHTPAALYEAFEPAQAKRILDRLEFHYTPTHGSWLNMVEIEIGVLCEQCLADRIPDENTLRRESAAWETKRNEQQATVNWQFTSINARNKLKRLYPMISKSA
jgi:hypothetical protein